MILTVTWILRNIYQFQQIKSNPTHDAWLKVVSSQKVQNPIIILRLSTARTRDKSSLPLSGSVGRDVDDVDGKVVHTQRLEEILGLGVDLERRLLGSSKSRDLGDVSESISANEVYDRRNKTYWSFRSLSSSCNLKEIPRTGPFWIRFIKWVVTAFRSIPAKPFLKFNTLTTSNLVPQPLGGNSGDLIKDSLVGAAESVSHMYFILSNSIVGRLLQVIHRNQTPTKISPVGV